ncbi:hypothetical protein FFF34_009735 [Inquilinus sp. KBS0705]|nr:hypothetical protein FFF34_009735 [Inquilinus sp. KBS0705]
METITTTRNPLININDEQWIKLVELLTDNVLALNSRKLLTVECLYTTGGHYPALYFRLTTVLEDPSDADPKTEVSGFVFGFNNEWDDDVYIHPLSSQGYWEEWLQENGITCVFNYHEVGLRKLVDFLEKELKLWAISEEQKPVAFAPNQWRLLKAY